MLEAKYEWQVAPEASASQVKELAKALNVSELLATLLIAKGLTDVDTAREWLQPTGAALNDPATMYDMARGTERIQEAVATGDLITVYGDYDADGLTSTSLMYETLDSLGANVNYYIPNRFDDGYGPNVDAFNRLIDAGTQLFVTVDNGVAGNEAIASARERGVDVVVTDHHELPEELPDAYAIIHPRHPEGNYPFGGLSGVGVAFKVAQALLEVSVDELSDELDLVAIGEIADLVPLDGENHALVKFGLQVLGQTQRTGLVALMKTAGVDQSAITEESVGFGIAPRLNALGRLGDANPAVELLTTVDDERASELAEMIDKKNATRQDMVKQISDDALQQATTPENEARHTLIIHGVDWHEGVLGIVASKIVEATHKPTLVLSENQEAHTMKGSGRSVAGYDLFKAIDPVRDHLVAFGGHAMACGLTVQTDQVDTLATALEDACVSQDVDFSAKPSLSVAAKISLDEINEAAYTAVHQLGPFGPDNTQPMFEVHPTTVTDVKTMGATQSHMKFTMTDDSSNHVPAIAFGRGAVEPEVSANPTAVSVVGTLSTNTWQGRTTYQLMVKDLKVEGIAIVDARTNNLAKSMFTKAASYLFFHESLAKKIAEYLPDNATIIRVGVDELPATVDRLVIVDCPDDITQLEDVLKAITVNGLTAYFYESDSAYLSGMPSRAEYAKLFKFVKTHHDVNVGKQMDVLCDYLKIDRDKLIFMIQLFFEVGFVKMESGVLNGVSETPRVDLTAATAYKQRLTRIDTEEKLLYSKGPQLKSWLLGAMKQA